MKAIAVTIWVCAAVLLLSVGCSALAHGSGGGASSVAVLPDLPEGWEKAGAAGLVVLVVLLFLTYLRVTDRQQKQLDFERAERDSKLHQEHADRLSALAHELSDKFCKSIADQQENCKVELAQLASVYKEQVSDLKAQNNTFAQRLLSLSGRASATEVKASEGMGS